MLKDDDLLSRIEDGHETAGLDTRRLTMLRYAEKLTRTPASMRPEDVTRLRASGFDDSDILAISEVTAYYAFVNRIADGLGVSLEDD